VYHGEANSSELRIAGGIRDERGKESELRRNYSLRLRKKVPEIIKWLLHGLNAFLQNWRVDMSIKKKILLAKENTWLTDSLSIEERMAAESIALIAATIQRFARRMAILSRNWQRSWA